jgi:hypothetical protein
MIDAARGTKCRFPEVSCPVAGQRCPCAYRKLNTHVLMVQSTKHRSCFDPTDALNVVWSKK